MNSERYIEIINNFFLPELRRKRIPIRHVWFQQDGATAHTARAPMDVIRPLFPGCLISRFSDIHWPSRFPDLPMYNYFLWGHLKACVYEHKPRTLEELKEDIEEVAQIDRAVIEKVYANFEERLQKYIIDNGYHMTDVVFHT